MDWSLIISSIAIIFAFLSFYYNYLKGSDIKLLTNKVKVDEISLNKKDIPDLPITITLFFFNQGNRAGGIRNVDFEIEPTEEFKKFYERLEKPYLKLPLTIKDRDAHLINGNIYLKLNPLIKRDYRTLDRINIEGDGLKDFLQKATGEKRKFLADFIKFLKINKKLGDLRISFEKTAKKKFITDSIYLEVRHSYSRSINYLEDILSDYNLEPSPERIIDEVIKKMKIIKNILESCLKDFEKYGMENKWWFGEASDIKRYTRDKNIHIEILKKCKRYKKFVLELLRLLKEIDKHSEKVSEINSTPSETKKEALLLQLKVFRKELREKIKNIIPKLDAIIKELEEEMI